MRTAIRTIGHEDTLSLVDHLEELRTRLIISVVALVVAFGVCFWQNHAVLRIVNAPVSHQTHRMVREGKGPFGQIWTTQQHVRRTGQLDLQVLGILDRPGNGLSAPARAELRALEPRLEHELSQLPRKPQGSDLTTLGLSEPFTTTLTVTLFAGLILALPVILWEVYGFILPAFSPRERRVANSLVASIPLLFGLGVAFGYFVVLPAAVHFFQNFNSDQFDILIQAAPYYKIAGTILLAMGIIFQTPVAILAASRLELVTPAQLRKGRPYAVIACAAVAAFLPGDFVTLMLETVPLYLLYELSILLAVIFAWRERRRAERRPPGGPGGPSDGGAGAPPGPGMPPGGMDPEVAAAIDHFDPSLSG